MLRSDNPIGGTTGKVALFIVALLGLAAIPVDAAAAPGFTIILDDGTTLLASRVEPWPQDLIRVISLDGSERFISTNKIKSITDETGRDRTGDAISGRRTDRESPSPSTSPEAAHGFVFRPRPLPVAKSYFVYELGISTELGDSYSQQHEQTMLSLELGYMRNLTTRNAVGFGVIGMTGDQVSKLAVRGRYRRWLSSGVGLDGTLGLTVAGGDEYGNGPLFPGGIASVGLQMEGIVGVTLEAEHARFQTGSDTHSDALVRLRGQLGSGAGIVGTVFIVGLGILYIVSMDGSY